MVWPATDVWRWRWHCCQGHVTTLKRNGSDYSATIMGALFRAKHITIWTDVDGVYSADPRKVLP
jgi:bifunctional aspartokinase / homoserine dehydrogenase 1